MTETSGDSYRQSVKFVLDGRVVEIDHCDPNRTVLQYLREDLGMTGTKEGCAEGDCGACTVAVADVDSNGRLQARAVNACIQFLPTLDGRELITVESLARDGLHPVQQAMIECHASQCGFCTPGFVMSLFALYKNDVGPGRRAIDDALAGNLCRCTGYQPIIDAARRMHEIEADGDDWLSAPGTEGPNGNERDRIAVLQSLAEEAPLCVEGNGRRFFAPHDVETFAALVDAHPAATILAGGTDIGLWVTKQHRDQDVIIYAGRVRELATINVDERVVDIGAAVTLTDAMPVIVRHFPSLEELFLRFASPPIRNAGTLGGNVANGSPIGDTMPALLALDTTLVLRRGSESREIALGDFYLDYQQTALEDGEFVERIRVPLTGEQDFVRAYKVSKRFDQDISGVCAAFSIRRSGDQVTSIRLGFGGMAAIPRRATRCEEAIVGKTWSEETIGEAADALQADFTPITDMRSSESYRRRLCQNLLKRFFLESTGQGTPGVYGYER